MSSTQETIVAPAPISGLVPTRTPGTLGQPRADALSRPDLYRFVHKGLRAFLSDTLDRCGRMDAGDDRDVAQTLAQVRSLVELCDAHLHKEEQFLHPAMEARRPGTARDTQGDHASHLQAFADIEANVRAVEEATGPERAGAALRLYHHLALFVAENLEHMHVEEIENNAVLWAAYSDDELRALQKDLVGSIPPAEMAVFMRWMIPAMAPAERAMMLSGIKQTAPAEVFTKTVNGLKVHLTERDWNKLMAALAGL